MIKQNSGMQKLKFAIILGIFLIFGIAIFAEELPQEPSSETHGPNEAEIQKFEQEFGAPPEAFKEPEIETPKFEPPGKISDELKQYIGNEEELVKVACAMAHLKSGELFSAMDALEKYLIPVIENVKTLGIEIEAPNPELIKTKATTKIEAICSAKSLNEAENLIDEFYAWGTGQVYGEFSNIRGRIEEEMNTKGEELRSRVKSEIEEFIVQEKARIESEIQQEAESLVESKEAEIIAQAEDNPEMGKEDFDSLVEASKSDIDAQIQAKVDAKKAEIEKNVKAKVEEIIGPQKKQFEAAGKAFEGLSGKIQAEIKANLSEYDKYKEEAFRLRKILILKILDKNLEEGLKQLDAASADIEAAKKEDPSIESAEQIKAELQQNRKVLEEKLNAALEIGDEVVFQNALSEFRVKWETIRQNGEKTASQSISKACNIALVQFDKARNQMEPGLLQIQSLQSRCADSTSKECLRVNEFSSRFEGLSTKITDLKIEMALAEKMCQSSEIANKGSLIALLKKIQTDAKDLKIFGEALESEKSKVIAESFKEVCDQILPQFAAARAEIANNDLVVLENNLEKCNGRNTQECEIVNQLSGNFDILSQKIKVFLSGVDEIKTLCYTAKEGDFEKLGSLLNGLKTEGEEIKILGKGLRAEQAEKASQKAFCRAIVPKLGIVKGEISAGLQEIFAIQTSCEGKTTEKCRAINALNQKFSDIEKQAKGIFEKVSKANAICKNPGTEQPSQELLLLLESLKSNEEEIKKAILDLRIQADGAKVGKGIIIEAESEENSFLLPRTEAWHSHREINPSWRPPYYGEGVWYLSRGGEWLSYAFDVPTSGTYSVWVRDYMDKYQPRGVRVIVIDFDGKNYGAFSEVNIPTTSNNGNFGWHKVGTGVSLSAGSHMMKITKQYTTSGVAILDVFYLTAGTEIPSEK